MSISTTAIAITTTSAMTTTCVPCARENHPPRFEHIWKVTSKKLSLRAFLSEAISLKSTDRFGKKRLAMTMGFFRKKWLEATWC
jgi:hypothetical protein